MGLPKFEEVHPSFTAGGFGCVNEEYDIVRSLIANQPVRKCGSIASAGEIMLFAMLSHTTGEVIAVDHSYRSLAACWLKILFINTLGPKGAKDLFENKPYYDAMKLAEKVAPQLPSPALIKQVTPAKMSYNMTTQIPAITYSDFDQVRREWHYVDMETLERVAKKLDKLTLLHGDITDLKKYCFLDCLYVSNAVEHMNNKYKYPSYKEFASLVKDGGSVLTSGYVTSTDPRLKEAGLKHQKSIKGFRSSWTYSRLKKVAVKEIAA